jgi:HAD superfamily hydrolase (TIGR01509 family)
MRRVNVKAVVFVLDGTIATLNLDHTTIRAEARNHLAKAGIPASILSMNENLSDMLEKTEIFLKNNGKPDRTVRKTRNEVSQISEKYELEAAKTAELLPGIEEELETLKKKKLKIGLITANSEKTTNYMLKRFGLSRFFNDTTPRNKVRSVKPNPEHLHTSLKALRVKPEETLLVTTDHRDVQSAREFHVITVGIPIGTSSEKELTDAGVNYLASSVSDVSRLVDAIGKTSRPRKRSL